MNSCRYVHLVGLTKNSLKLHRSILLILLSCLFSTPSFSQSDTTYRLYDGKGREISWNELLSGLEGAEVVLFGELHNNTTIHQLELDLFQALQQRHGKQLRAGAEMFASSQQSDLDEYLQEIINDSLFESSTKLWPNYSTDYRPLLIQARENQVPFFATNAPREYARFVAYQGLDSLYPTLNDSAKELLAPTPIPLSYKAPGYKELLEQDFGAGHQMDTRKMVQAQAIKDATMAHFIHSNLEEGLVFLHFHGNFHSQNHGGIAWYLKQYDKKRKVVVISSVESDSASFEKEWKKTGDFILVVPTASPKSY